MPRRSTGPLRMTLDRFKKDLARITSSGLPVVLAITHSRGGGVQKHIDDLAIVLDGHAIQLVLHPTRGDNVELTWSQPGEALRMTFSIGKEYGSLLNLLRIIGVNRIHFHHLLGLPAIISNLPHDLGIPFDVTIHDYYTICPQINLTRRDNRYCREPDLETCRKCLREQPAPGRIEIEAWRDKHATMVESAQRVIVPSKDVGKRINRYFPLAKVLVAYHPESNNQRFPPSPAPISQETSLKIAVLGALTEIKGADLLELCAIEVKRLQLPIKFELIGYGYRHLAQEPSAALTIHGRYDERALPSILGTVAPDIVWFPALWPETYSYTLSSTLDAGFPLAVPDIGAFSERVEGRPWSWVLPWDLSPSEFNDFFLKIRKENFMTGCAPFQNKPPILPPFRYPDDYISPLRLRLIDDSTISNAKVEDWFSNVVQNTPYSNWSVEWLYRLRSLRILSWLARRIPRDVQRQVKNRLLGLK